MAATKIKTIQVIDFNSLEDHVSWLVSNRVNKHNYRLFPAKVVFLDFSLSRFLKPYHIAPLACLIHEYQEKGFIIRIKEVPAKIKEYLKSFNFDQFCEKQDKNSFKPKDKKTFSLWHINQHQKDFYAIEVQKYFENNHFAGNDLFVLGNSLAELMNNIFDHANSSIPGYTFTQYNTRNNSIITCVCDFGIGIPVSVNNFLKQNGEPKLSNIQALQKALELKFSALTKPHNRGFGWDTIISSVKSLRGRILIISKNAVLVLRSDDSTTTHKLKSNFPGTLVVISLNTLDLPPKEELTDELTLI